MKRIYIIIYPLVTLLLVACSKTIDTTLPGVTVSLDPAKLIGDTFTYKLGDTTNFLLSGSSGNIAFYPGDAGRRYEYRNRSSALGNTVLSFSSKAEFGTQLNTLQVFAAVNLKGLDSVSVVNAAWTDITSRAMLSNSATVVNSGDINLSDIATKAGDSLFIAFRYTGTTGSTQRTWTITNYLVQNRLPDVNYALGTMAGDGNYWTRYGNVWTPANARWTPTSAQLQIVGGGATNPGNTSWIVSKALYAGRVAPDLAIGIKNINNPDISSYAYKYTAVGTYKATWVIFNNTVDKQETLLKEFYIRIIP